MRSTRTTAIQILAAMAVASAVGFAPQAAADGLPGPDTAASTIQPAPRYLPAPSVPVYQPAQQQTLVAAQGPATPAPAQPRPAGPVTHPAQPRPASKPAPPPTRNTPVQNTIQRILQQLGLAGGGR